VVECPRGSAVKLKYEPRLGAFTVSRALPLGLTILSTGFIPGTLAADGDPLDALALHDVGAYPYSMTKGAYMPLRALCPRNSSKEECASTLLPQVRSGHR
jgi:inorganic pyrophosphatase